MNELFVRALVVGGLGLSKQRKPFPLSLDIKHVASVPMMFAAVRLSAAAQSRRRDAALRTRAMSVEPFVTFLYEEYAEDVVARLARGTGNAGEDLENLRTAILRCGDDIHENLLHGLVI